MQRNSVSGLWRFTGFRVGSSHMTASFRLASSSEDQMKAMMVRCIVFCGEQNVPYSIERDEFEEDAVHIIGELEGEPVAAGRIRYFPEYAKLERIAVLRPYRGRGIGSELVRFLMSIAQERGYSSYRMNAQVRQAPFYAGLGFHAVGERFMEADIEHVLMVRDD